MSEMRGVIVIFTVISCVVALVLIMPTQFFNTDEADYNYIANPDSLEILAWNNTYILNATDFDAYNFELNGYNWYVLTLDTQIYSSTYANWWVFYWDYDHFAYYYNDQDISQYSYDGTPNLNLTALDALVAGTADNETISLKFKNSKTQAIVSLSYNSSLYTGYDDALDDGGLIMVFSIDFNDRATSLNAFTLVGLILTASLPDVDPVLTGIFAFIGWGLVAGAVYMVFIFALRIVGAVFGGGGA